MAGQKIAGIDVLVSVSADGGTSKTVVGGQTSASLTRGTSVIDVTSKDGGGWSESIAGMRNWGVDAEGFAVKDDAGLKAINSAWLNGEPLYVSFELFGEQYEGKSILSDFPSEFPQDDAVTFSISLTGTGALDTKPVA